METFDVAIVGGGVMGSATAWRLCAAGLKVVLFEKSVTLTHTEGSSHGHSRIIRSTYLQPHYAKLMSLAYPLWDSLSQNSGCGALRAYSSEDPCEPPLVRYTGGLSIVCHGSKEHLDLLHACASARVATKEVLPCEAFERWGLSLPEGTVAIEEAGCTGVAVGVGRCVAAMQASAAALGAVLHSDAAVVDISATADGGVQIQVQKGSSSGGVIQVVAARRAVLCPGAWGGPLLEGILGMKLPLQPLLCSTAYYRLVTAPSENSEGCGGRELPILIDWRPKEEGGGIYGCPVTNWGSEGEAYPATTGTAYKFAIHGGVPTDAASRPFTPCEDSTVKPVQAWVSKHAPIFSPHPIPGSTTTCLYTMTPDEDFVLDEVALPPEKKRGVGEGNAVIFLCAGFSGHGFKFAPLIGEIVTQWCKASLGVVNNPEGVQSEGPSPLESLEQWLQEATGGHEIPYLPLFSAKRFENKKE